MAAKSRTLWRAARAPPTPQLVALAPSPRLPSSPSTPESPTPGSRLGPAPPPGATTPHRNVRSLSPRPLEVDSLNQLHFSGTPPPSLLRVHHVLDLSQPPLLALLLVLLWDRGARRSLEQEGCWTPRRGTRRQTPPAPSARSLPPEKGAGAPRRRSTPQPADCHRLRQPVLLLLLLLWPLLILSLLLLLLPLLLMMALVFPTRHRYATIHPPQPKILFPLAGRDLPPPEQARAYPVGELCLRWWLGLPQGRARGRQRERSCTHVGLRRS